MIFYSLKNSKLDMNKKLLYNLIKILFIILIFLLTFIDITRGQTISFEIIQPESSPKTGLDLPKGTEGNNHIYDMDGDGDLDFLYLASSPGGMVELIAFLNDGQGNYERVDQDHNFEFNQPTNYPIVRNGPKC